MLREMVALERDLVDIDFSCVRAAECHPRVNMN
jgi:hypothetical protein